MVTLTATASGLPTTQLVLTGLVLLAVYAAACWVYPYVQHGRCNGTGKLRSPSGKAWRGCRGCRGTGRKIRVGRRIWGAVRTERKRGSS